MAGDFQKQIFVGRLTRDPETKIFNNGTKVAKFGFAFCGRRTKDQSGQWKEEPCFIDCQAFDGNSGNGRQLASLIEQYLHKGSKAMIETVMHLEQWTSQDGTKRQALKFTIREIVFLDSKEDRENRSQGQPRQTQRQQPANQQSGGGYYGDVDVDADEYGGSGGGAGVDDVIPF